MRLVYCPSCREVTLRSRFERDVCERCGSRARPIRVAYPWQYFAGVASVLAGAVFLILPQVAGGFPWAPVVATLPQRLVWLVLFVGVGLYFSSWGLRVMKGAALARGAELYPEADP